MYTLTYFPVTGLGEVTRLIFAFAEVPYNQIFPKNWFEEKHQHLFHTLPRLDYETKDGKKRVLYESVVIAQFLAKQFGLLSDDIHDEAYLNSIVMNQNAILMRIIWSSFQDGKIEEKTSSFQEFRTTNWPEFLDIHAKIIMENGSEGYYFGQKTTLPDIFMFCLIDYFGKGFNVPIPGPIQKLVERLNQIPSIAKHMTSPKRFITLPLLKFWQEVNTRQEFFAKLGSTEVEEWKKLVE